MLSTPSSTPSETVGSGHGKVAAVDVALSSSSSRRPPSADGGKKGKKPTEPVNKPEVQKAKGADKKPVEMTRPGTMEQVQQSAQGSEQGSKPRKPRQETTPLDLQQQQQQSGGGKTPRQGGRAPVPTPAPPPVVPVVAPVVSAASTAPITPVRRPPRPQAPLESPQLKRNNQSGDKYGTPNKADTLVKAEEGIATPRNHQTWTPERTADQGSSSGINTQWRDARNDKGGQGGRRSSFGSRNNGGSGGDGGRGGMVGGSPGRTHNRTPNRGGNIGQMDGRQGNRGQSFGEGHVRQKVYEDYMPLLKVNEGLAAKTLHQAVLRINKKDPHDAYVTCDAYTEDVYICGKIARNRAFDGDLVVIEILDGDEKKALVERSDDRKENKRREDEAKLKKVVVGGEVEEVEVLVGAEEAEVAIPRIYGKVVCILEQRVNQVFIGTLSIDPPHRNGARGPQKPSPGPVSSSINTIWFKPSDRRVPFLVIPVENAPEEYLKNPGEHMTHLWKATVKRWPSHCQFPYGAVQGCVGQMGAIGAETQALLIENGIFWDEFDDKVLACLPATPWVIPEEEIRNRRDLRETRIFSVDPATARDLDDALSIEELEDGTFKVGVHIADVSHFVNAGNALDEEAYLRATTVYLVQKAIPMLPRLLCEELCSLNPGVDRLAFSVIFHLTATGQPVSPPWYGRTLIRSCAKLSYDHAQALIDDLPDEVIEENLPPFEVFSPHSLDQIRRDTRALHKLSLELRKGRFEGGALTISSVKLWFAVDAVGHPVETGVYELKDSNRMIEEFMLLANMAVAAKIASAFPTTALLRRHAQPKPKPLRDFIDLASTLGYHIDGTSSKTLQQSFADISDENAAEALRQLCIKPMQRAVYFSTGDLDLEFWGHYALNVPVYTHFTSPIRRYCDLVVHRLLDCAITNTETHYVCDVVGQIAKRCNERKFSAKDAQDASQHVYLCVYLSLKGGDEGVFADALVYRVGDRWFDVIVEEFGVEKRVWVDDGVESGEILGCKMDKEEGCLRVYWKKDGEVEEVPKEGEIKVEELEFGEEEFPVLGTEGVKEEKEDGEDSDENDDMEDATPKKKTDGEEDHKKRRRGRRPRKRRGADGAGLVMNKVDPMKNGVEQVLRVFKVVRVRLVVDMSRSPPELKLRPVGPFCETGSGQKGGRRMEGTGEVVVNCPGIVETAD